MIIATSSPRKWKIGSELIKWYQGGTKYSHVLLIDSQDMVFQASHGRVHTIHIENFLLENYIVDIFEVKDSEVDMEYAKRKVGVKYGFLQLARIAFKYLTGIRLIDNGNKRLICSEFIGRCLMLDWVNDYTDPKEIAEYLKNKKP